VRDAGNVLIAQERNSGAGIRYGLRRISRVGYECRFIRQGARKQAGARVSGPKSGHADFAAATSECRVTDRSLSVAKSVVAMRTGEATGTHRRDAKGGISYANRSCGSAALTHLRTLHAKVFRSGRYTSR